MPDEYKEMRLAVQVQAKIFTRPNGSTLYRVEALDEHGNEVPDLRTFAASLPRNVCQTYKLKRYDHPEHGTTWTILDPSGGPSKNTSDVEKRLDEVERRLKKVEQRIGESDDGIHPAQQDDEVKGPAFF